MLRRLWGEVETIASVAERFNVARGWLNVLVQQTCTYANQLIRFVNVRRRASPPPPLKRRPLSGCASALGVSPAVARLARASKHVLQKRDHAAARNRLRQALARSAALRRRL